MKKWGIKFISLNADILSKNFFYCFILSIFIFLSLFFLRQNGFLQSLELSVYDSFWRNLEPYKFEPVVVLIGANDEDFKNFGWPISDGILGELILKLSKAQPSVIGVDLFRDREISPGSEILIEAFSNHNVIGIIKVGQNSSTTIYPHQILFEKGAFGFSDIVIDVDGLVRRGLLFLDDGQNYYTSFSLQLALNHLAGKNIFPRPWDENTQYMVMGNSVFIPLEKDTGPYRDADSAGYQYLLDFKFDISRIKTFSFSEVINEKVDFRIFKDKIIIIGVAADSVKDIFFIPPNKSKLLAEINTFGIALHALMVEQIINIAEGKTRPIKSISERNENIILFIFCIAGFIFGFFLRSFVLFSIFAIVGIFLIVSIAFILLGKNLFIPVVPYVIGWISSMASVTSFMSYQEKTDRLVLMQLFSRHVSQGVADLVWKNREQFLVKGRLKPLNLIATIFFSDIRGFTSISENLDPEVLMEWLNEYMKEMSDIIMANGGTIDKYIGDAIMAIFGFPVISKSDEDIRKDAMNAINSALFMDSALSRLNKSWLKRGLPQIKIRVGIYTGSVVAGCLGSENRLEYTVLGDTVNTASRMESFPDNENVVNLIGKNCRILIGESTYRYINDFFITKEIGEALLKGKKKSVKVYQILEKNY